MENLVHKCTNHIYRGIEPNIHLFRKRCHGRVQVCVLRAPLVSRLQTFSLRPTSSSVLRQIVDPRFLVNEVKQWTNNVLKLKCSFRLNYHHIYTIVDPGFLVNDIPFFWCANFSGQSLFGSGRYGEHNTNNIIIKHTKIRYHSKNEKNKHYKFF